MTLYLKEDWEMAGRWYQDWVDEPDEDEYFSDLEDWNFGVDPRRLEWVAPILVEENCVIWGEIDD
jgi:hypothetical protein